MIPRGVNYHGVNDQSILAFIDLKARNDISFIHRNSMRNELSSSFYRLENGDLEKGKYLLQDYAIRKWGNLNLSLNMPNILSSKDINHPTRVYRRI